MVLYEILMQKLSLTMEKGTIVKWHKQVGDKVASGELLLEVSTDKINMEMDSMYNGILKEILAKEDQSVPVMTPVAIIEGVAGQMVFGSEAATEASKAGEAVPAQPEQTLMPLDAKGEAKVLASPAAKVLAAKSNIDLSLISGTGPNGRIIRENVEDYLRALPRFSHVAEKIAAEANSPLMNFSAEKKLYKRDVLAALAALPADLGQKAPLSPVQEAMSSSMVTSWTHVPHVTLHRSAKADAVGRLRDAVLNNYNEKISYTDIIVKACSMALECFPSVNSSYLGNAVKYHQNINIGVATDTAKGLIVPVVKESHKKSLLQVNKTTRELIDKAREGGLSLDEVSGGTFTVSNLGGMGVEYFTPIINPPESAILGVGSIKTMPEWQDKQFVPVSVISLSLSFDHRHIDGATAARFLDKIIFFLENPYFFAI